MQSITRWQCSSVCLFVCLFIFRLWNFSSYLLHGSTWLQVGAYRMDSDTCINHGIHIVSEIWINKQEQSSMIAAFNCKIIIWNKNKSNIVKQQQTNTACKQTITVECVYCVTYYRKSSSARLAIHMLWILASDVILVVKFHSMSAIGVCNVQMSTSAPSALTSALFQPLAVTLPIMSSFSSGSPCLLCDLSQVDNFIMQWASQSLHSGCFKKSSPPKKLLEYFHFG